jgi:Thioredoxin
MLAKTQTISTKIMINYWQKAIGFSAYVALTETKTNTASLSEAEQKYAVYYPLSLQRMQRIAKSYQINLEQAARLNSLGFKGHLLVISEPWCGDASQIIPVLHRFFEPSLSMRIIARDEYPELMAKYLTNGSESIPIVIVLDENYQAIGHWGPRPKATEALLADFKQNHQDKERFLLEIQQYYNKNKGFDIVAELLDLMANLKTF